MAGASNRYAPAREPQGLGVKSTGRNYLMQADTRCPYQT